MVCAPRFRGPIGATPATSTRGRSAPDISGRGGSAAWRWTRRPWRRRSATSRSTPRAQDWRWSSVHAHLGLVADDAITATAPVIERFPDLAERIAAGEDEAMSARLRRAEQIGRPVGGAAFIAGLERQTGRSLAPAPTGPKPKERRNARLES
jgi:hypothetical protein